MKHNGFIMRTEYPVVAAKVKDIAVSNGLLVPDLDFSILGPFSHRRFKVEVVIYSIVVEFLVFSHLGLHLEAIVDPIKNVQDLNCCLKQVHVDHSGHDVHCDEGLKLYHILMNLFR
jgi:hypothetical protein